MSTSPLSTVHQVAVEAPRCGVPGHQPWRRLHPLQTRARVLGHIRSTAESSVLTAELREAELQTPGWELGGRSLSSKTHQRAALLQLTPHQTRPAPNHLQITTSAFREGAQKAHRLPARSLCLVGSLGFDFPGVEIKVSGVSWWEVYQPRDKGKLQPNPTPPAPGAPKTEA